MARRLARLVFLLSLAAGVALAGGCAEPAGVVAQGAEGAARVPADDERIAATTPSGRTLVLEVARSDAKRARGLMQRREVPSGTGMIFYFERPGRHAMWMYDCLVALDLLWLDEAGRVLHLVEAAPPCEARPCPSYAPPVDATLVVEVAAGAARPLGLVPGARLLIDPRPLGGAGEAR